MPDKLTPQQRRKCMQRIKSKDTKPELIVRKYLFSHGFRYRLNVKRLPGSPDIVLPKTNTPFWQAKIDRNQQRDLQRRKDLRNLGWHTITLWECQLKPKTKDLTLASLEKTLYQIYLGDR